MTQAATQAARGGEGARIAALVAARLDRLEGGDPAAVAQSEAELARPPGGARLDGLCALFGLTAADRALLLTCLAADFDPGLGARYHRLTGRAWATEWLAGHLFDDLPGPLLTGASPARLWGLIRLRADQPGEPPALSAYPSLRDWIAGVLAVPEDLLAAVRFIEPRPPLRGWPVATTAEAIGNALARRQDVFLAVEGMVGAGRTTFVALVARALGRRCLAVDPGACPGGWTAEHALTVHRFAHVAGAVLVWRRLPRSADLAPPGLWPAPVQATALDPGEAAPDAADLAPLAVTLPAMEADERGALIAAAVSAAAGWSAATRTVLARRRTLTPAAIARLGRIAPMGESEAVEAANRVHEAAMGDLARRMTGTLDWDDLILPARLKEDLKDFAFEAETRADAWSDPALQRLFAREAGLVGLFHGPPGTGKTMAAQVIAGAMGVDLYRIDCASVISKFIGETSKNLSAIFARAARIDAVLFFDEADALFARRTEVRDSNDKYANADTSQLLQLIEGAFEGTAILATNRMADMDPAFKRRIRYVFDFARPGAPERTALWRQSAAVLVPGGGHDALWPVLGEALEITGAQIKTALLAAHFAARRRGGTLGAADILRAVEREYAKEGRTLGRGIRERIRAHA